MRNQIKLLIHLCIQIKILILFKENEITDSNWGNFN